MAVHDDRVHGSFEVEADRVRGAGLELLKIDSFAEIHQVLRLPSFVQAKHPRTYVLQGDSVIWIDGEAHSRRRKLENELVKPERLRVIEGVVVATLIANLRALHSASPSGPVRADLFELVRVAVMGITAHLAGFDQVVDYQSANRLRRLTERMVEGIQAQWAAGAVDDAISDALAAREEWRYDFYEPSLERRRQLVAESRAGQIPVADLPADLLTMMLLHPEEWTSAEVMQHEATIYSTGSGSTTTQAICHTVYELASWIESHPTSKDALGDRDFLSASSNEALRLHPPAPALVRTAIQDVTLRSGRTIAAGERVYLDVAAGNRDETTYGANAHIFDPHRTVPFHRSYGFTFGGGPHLCPGLQLTVGTPAAAAQGDDDPFAGTLVGILQILYRAGVRLDPDDMPAPDPRTTRGTYVRFPVLFTQLDGLEENL